MKQTKLKKYKIKMEDELLTIDVNLKLKTHRDLKKNPKLAKKIELETKELFNINPFYRYELGMSNYHIKSEKWDNPITIKHIDPTKYKNHEYQNVKIGNLVIKKRIEKTVSPKIGNSVTDNWNLIRILNKECPPTWKNAFKLSYTQLNYINDVLLDEEKDGKILCPTKNQIFRAFELCPLNNVKLVIIGQDPYHTIGPNGPVANGLCFSTNRGLKLQPSLRNIYNELERTVKDFKSPGHGDLTRWAKQGVLLINSALTVTSGKPEAHSFFWQGFTINIMKVLNKVKPRCIYLLWGGFAKKMKEHITASEYVLETSHPSPLSNYRGFKGCNHFNMANKMLESFNETPIDWRLIK